MDRIGAALDALKTLQRGTGKKPWHSRAYRAMFARQARELHGRHWNCTVSTGNCTVALYAQ